MPDIALLPDTDAIRRDLEYMTARWSELSEPAVFEIRAFKEGAQPQTAKFAPDWMDDAVEWVEQMNGYGFNVYAVRNPIRSDISGSASDADIIASFFLWADCDEPTSAENVRQWGGPKYSAAVITGRVPGVRVHTYWQLAEPCTDLAVWRETQVSIAAHFRSDKTVINPSRIMRIAGTVAYPAKHKQERGYVKELTTIRTEYEDGREPVTLDQMRRAFGTTQAAPAPQGSAAPFQIDTGELPRLDRERMAIQALEGKDWHHAVIRLVASYVSKGLSDGEIHALTAPLTLAGYTVDQTAAEVQTAIDGARRKGWTPEPDTTQQEQEAQVEAAQWPTVYDMFDENAVAPRQWVYAKHYLRSFVSVLASAGGIGKTSLQIVEALAICTGKPLLGEEVTEQCNVWLINLEDPMEEMQRRILAAMRRYGVTPDEVRGRLFVDAGRDFSLNFAVQTREGVTPNTALVAHLIKRIPELNIGAVFIDPFVGAHQINENDNMAVNAVVGQIRQVADETNCAIGLVHHIRKGNGEDANIDSVRGAGSLIGAARAARVINRVSEDDAIRLGVNAQEAIGIFRVDDGKANLSPPSHAATYRRMEGVQIANGEWIGVATDYKLPDEWGGMTDDVVNEMLRSIDLGIPDEDGNEEYYSIRPQDKDRWVGKVITDYNFKNSEHLKNEGQAKRIISQWQKSGLIEVTKYHSTKQRKERSGVLSTGRAGEVRE